MTPEQPSPHAHTPPPPPSAGIPVTVLMPTVAPIAKVEQCRRLGANVVVTGAHILEAYETALKDYSDVTYVNGFDDPNIIAGAGTLGLEMEEEVRGEDAAALLPSQA